MIVAEGMVWKRKRAEGPFGKLTCMLKDGVYLGVKTTTGEIIVGQRRRVAHEDGQKGEIDGNEAIWR